MSITGFTGQRIGAHTIDTTVSAVTTIVPEALADFILLECSTQNIRITFDGTTPSATVGFLLAKDIVHAIQIGRDTTLKIIEVAASASVQWQNFAARRDTDT